jgi:hypothetical protein
MVLPMVLGGSPVFEAHILGWFPLARFAVRLGVVNNPGD